MSTYNVTIPANAVGYFCHDFAAGSRAEQYGALCALGLQDEARAWRDISEEHESLCARRAQDQEPVGDDFLGSLEFKAHPLDARISEIEDRLSVASQIISAVIGAAAAKR